MLLVNFGGPRSLAEIPSFLTALLLDRDVIRTAWPYFVHRLFFTRIANKRAKKIEPDYQLIGGKSPIFEDTEALALLIQKESTIETIPFHRYLSATHSQFVDRVKELQPTCVLPLFPQFSYATTGSIARWFSLHLPREIVAKIQWIKSYADHPAYVASMQQAIRDFLANEHLQEDEVVLLFSSHGLPRAFIETGDPYERECMRSFQAISRGFPQAHSQLSYQSKFGRGEWLRPYTDELCHAALSWTQKRRHVVFVPLSFTSDHIETLFEIEYLYLPLIRKAGLQAYRMPALNQRPDWIQALVTIAQTSPRVPNHELYQ